MGVRPGGQGPIWSTWSGLRRVAVLAGSLAPLAFLPVLVGITLSAARLVGTDHPDFGTFTSATSDAHALELGQPLYQDPADGYTGTIYMPGVPLVLSLIYRLDPWNGWPALLNIFASTGLALAVARLAYRPEGEAPLDRALAGCGALGMGALAWWLVSVLDLDLLYSARVDQVAWALAIVGLLATAAAIRGSRWAEVAAVTSLTAAFWSKQSTVAAAVAAVLWVVILAMAGIAPRRFALRLPALLVAVNLVLFGVANLLTDGWEWFFNFQLPGRQADVAGAFSFLGELARGTGPALSVAGILWVAVLVDGRRARGPRLRLASWEARAATLLALFVVVGTTFALYFRRKVGGDDNQYIGVAWALGLLAALAYREARVRVLPAVAAAIVLGGLAAAAAIHPLRARLGRHDVTIPSLRTDLPRWPQPPASYLEYARSHLVYSPAFPELNVENRHVLYNGFYNAMDLLAGGEQPLYLVRGLLDRRFDAVQPIPESPETRQYSFGYGKWEENYTWKLNEVIRSRYRPGPKGVPPTLLVRRPGSEPARWMRKCFGPFGLAGMRFRIHRGGGFWCQSGTRLALARTPAPVSEVVTDGPVGSARGRLLIALPHPGTAVVTVGDDWRLDLRRPSGAREVLVRGPRGEPALTVHSGTVMLRFSRAGDRTVVSVGGQSMPVPLGDEHGLHFLGSRTARPVFDLTLLRLRTS